MATGVFWAVVMSAAGHGAMFVASVLSARILGEADFGRLAMIRTMVFALSGFAAASMAITATKYVSELRSAAPGRVGNVLGVCTLTTLATGGALSCVLLAAGPWMAECLLDSPELGVYLQCGAAYILFFAMNSYQIGALAGFEAFARIAWAGIMHGFLILATTAAMTWLFGLHGAVLGMVFSMAGGWLVFQHALRAECRRRGLSICYRGWRSEAGPVFAFAVPATACGFMGGLATMGAGSLLARQPGGFSQMALFNAANAIASVFLVLPGVVSRVSTPLLCNLRADGAGGRYRRAFWACLAINSGMIALAAAVAMPIAGLLLWPFGREFIAGAGALRLLLLVAIVETLTAAMSQALFAAGRIWTQLWIKTVWAAMLVGGAWFFTAGGGAAGLAAAFLLAWGCAAVLNAAAMRGEIDAERSETECVDFREAA